MVLLGIKCSDKGVTEKLAARNGNQARGWEASAIRRWFGNRVLKVTWVVPGRTQPDPRTKSDTNLGSDLFSL